MTVPHDALPTRPFRRHRAGHRASEIQVAPPSSATRDSNLCILESEFAKTLSPGGGTRTLAHLESKMLELTKDSGARSTPRTCSGGMKFSRSDFEMQRFENVKYEGRSKTAPYREVSQK